MTMSNTTVVEVPQATKKPTMQGLALGALKENRSQKGMSRQAIHKAIVEGFGGKDGPQFKSVERRMFDQAVEKQLLVKTGGCFKLGPHAKVALKVSKVKTVKKDKAVKVLKVGEAKKFVQKTGGDAAGKKLKQMKEVAKASKVLNVKQVAQKVATPKVKKPVATKTERPKVIKTAKPKTVSVKKDVVKSTKTSKVVDEKVKESKPKVDQVANPKTKKGKVDKQ
eukprot:Platyproteum_vivax@DN9219_c0_g1_i1.p1